jgi:hypothetical protein
METMKITESGKSYWGDSGVYQNEYNKLYKEHVPADGNAKTLNGELIRAISRLFYEYCNNGNCNAFQCSYVDEWETCLYCHGSGTVGYDEDEEDCPECGGDGQFYNNIEIKDVWVTKMYDNFLRLIKENVPTTLNSDGGKSIESVIDIICEAAYDNQGERYFNVIHMNVYNMMCDRVIYHVLNNEDKELPEWYKQTVNCKE